MQELARRVAKLLNLELKPPTPSKPEPPSVKIIKRGKCGDNVNYTLDENDMLTIFGKGTMWDFIGKYPINVYKDRPWESIHKTISHVEIQDGVTSIGSATFIYCVGLTSVTIPDSVISIGRAAFCGCTGLTSVIIPDSVTFIGSQAFYACAGLTSVSVPVKAKMTKNSLPENVIVEYRT